MQGEGKGRREKAITPRGAARGMDELDEQLLEEAVEHLNTLHERKALELAIATGEYIIEDVLRG